VKTVETEDLTRLASHFVLPGRVRNVTRLGDGLINDTWLVTTDRARGVLQRVNDTIFPHPDRIMSNLRRVTRCLAAKSDPFLRLPALVPCRSGGDWVEDGGQCWRMLEYIDGFTLRHLDSPALARTLGASLGRLHVLLSHLGPEGFDDPLPGFHDTGGYLEALQKGLCEWRGRSGPVLEEALSYIERHRQRARALADASLPVRIVHGDPKLDNVLFDPRSRRPLAWVDLDTLGPGGVLYDIGDCVRSACGSAGSFDLELATEVLAGWFEQARGFLSREEIERVPAAVWLLPFELGVRFLSDYLVWNRYFKVSEPEHNLRRAREQLSLARAIESRYDALEEGWRALSEEPGR